MLKSNWTKSYNNHKIMTYGTCVYVLTNWVKLVIAPCSSLVSSLDGIPLGYLCKGIESSHIQHLSDSVDDWVSVCKFLTSSNWSRGRPLFISSNDKYYELMHMDRNAALDRKMWKIRYKNLSIALEAIISLFCFWQLVFCSGEPWGPLRYS